MGRGVASWISVVVSSNADVSPGEIGLVVDSRGLLSVVVDRASASELLGIAAGDEVIVGRLDDEQSDSPSVSVELRRGAT